MAGAFKSIANVAAEHQGVHQAITEVFGSYGGGRSGDQVLVQPMVQDVALSGVALSRDIEAGGPYYVVNYDDLTGRTDTVTGGGESKTVLVHHARPQAVHSPRIRRIIATVSELVVATGCDDLDVEFCMTHGGQLYILQARPLAASKQWQNIDTSKVSASLDEVRIRLTDLMKPAAGVCGSTTVLGEMPDWNPAEMIGNAPRPLSLSLYKNLITDGAWWRARVNMGYRAVPHPLLLDLHGRPYIDVRLSLNSFLPQSVSDELAEMLVNGQLARLAAKPESHDKIEFEVAVTCRDLAFPTDRLAEDGLSHGQIAEFEYHLKGLTARALTSVPRMAHLLERTRGLAGHGDLAQMLDDCRNEGTIPFSELARHAFIGMTFLKSLVARGALSQYRADLFMHNIETVAGEFVADLHQVSIGEKSRGDFLTRYGHLRPGTYDILSARYDESPDLYLGRHSHAPEQVEPFQPTGEERKAIDQLLSEAGYQVDCGHLLHYVTAGVAAREEAKFNFTRNVSNGLAAIDRWGAGLGLSRDDLSFLEISDILNSADLGLLRDKVARGREFYELTKMIRLPHLLCEPDDIDVVRIPLGRPTFITGKSVTAPTIQLGVASNVDIDGHIVLIEAADPGYDWIFSHDIVGLVTKYGGANSHMAIRSAEFGLPAAIGCGERLYSVLASGKVLELDCAASRVKVVDSLR
ncbi:conserved protein of unknown function [Magnetospirillum gryphiswaldense MSR-1 v2]|uniref:PEP-utilising enzyme mobile domain-containing protein n=2 Tax=Magnetospirillum gryphiswaldense TaxID=55518 RepID=V6F526_MAGGM|nr:conserved protein of unknown function [Magnetospirillum gryphiswaldense MSR-1 v2]